MLFFNVMFDYSMLYVTFVMLLWIMDYNWTINYCISWIVKYTQIYCIQVLLYIDYYTVTVFISLVITCTYLTAINLPISRSELIVSCLVFAYKILRKLRCFLRRLACDQVKMTKTRYFACPDELNNILVGLWG